MSNTEMPVDSGVCQQCGMGVHLDEAGRTACDGCGEPTDRCRCVEPAT
ncbi:MAG: hypothetical protein AB1673_09980 [Actinomycetota bacterium]